MEQTIKMVSKVVAVSRDSVHCCIHLSLNGTSAIVQQGSEAVNGMRTGFWIFRPSHQLCGE